ILFAVALVLAVPFTVFLVRRVARVVAKWHTSVDLYPDRVVCRRGRREEDVPWEEVKSATRRLTHLTINGLDAGIQVQVTVDLEAGRRLLLGNHLEDAEALAENLLELSRESLSRKVRGPLEAGEMIDFGRGIQAGRPGLVVGGTRYAWAQVRGGRLERGHLVLDVGARAPVKVELGQIPNCHVLLPLIDELAAEARGQAAP